ncbi:T9SS type A sorting domain-containing protein [Luteirhabdus pelagi]|uniref:T9SS type A sorting domain-containing protein n=1 Tax=Luteirhabdus pelagi TaxID=2792783 RepID=UPI0019398D2F|nr:T9SS type A sorting domain-containing protein [Luteirhabdus pelagi]
MRKILLLYGLLVASISYAQDLPEDLFDVWYLHSYEYDLGPYVEIVNIDPPINPTLIIYETLEFEGLVCNDYLGNFIYNEVDDTLLLETFSPCLCGTCVNPPQSHIDLENDYFGYFEIDEDYEYTLLFPETDEKILILSLAPGFDLTFRNHPALSNPDVTLDQITLYPNPTTDLLNISKVAFPVERISIYDVLGQNVYTSHQLKEIDVSTLPAGIYTVEITVDGKKTTKKILKQ